MASFSVLQINNKKELPRFCRACGCELNEACEIENNPARPELPLLVRRYMPELDKEVENACLCLDCVSILYVFHNFKRKCLRTEEDIRLHIRKHPEVKAVNLNDIFPPKQQTNNTIDGIDKPCLGTINEETRGARSSRTITKDITCELCCRSFYRQSILYHHKRRYHGRERYQCDKCSREFALKNLYDVHMAYHRKSNAGRYTCKICNFVYQSMHALKRHNIVKHSSDDQKPFQCEVCARRFVGKTTLTDHMRTHTGDKLYKCPMCNKYATSVIAEIYRHIREVHNVDAKLKVVCARSSCRRVFLTEKALQAHRRKFHRDIRNKRKRYQCDKCSRDFASENKHHEHLEYHKRPNADRFVCEQCNLVYHTYMGLRLHNINKHSSDDKKRFQCEVCAKKFVLKKKLTEHMWTHTGDRPFKCPLCKYSGAAKTRVYHHVRVNHTNIKVQFNGAECVIVQ